MIAAITGLEIQLGLLTTVINEKQNDQQNETPAVTDIIASYPTS